MLSLSKRSASIMEISSITSTLHSPHRFCAFLLRCTRPTSSGVDCTCVCVHVHVYTKTRHFRKGSNRFGP